MELTDEKYEELKPIVHIFNNKIKESFDLVTARNVKRHIYSNGKLLFLIFYKCFDRADDKGDGKLYHAELEDFFELLGKFTRYYANKDIDMQNEISALENLTPNRV